MKLINEKYSILTISIIFSFYFLNIINISTFIIFVLISFSFIMLYNNYQIYLYKLNHTSKKVFLYNSNFIGFLSFYIFTGILSYFYFSYVNKDDIFSVMFFTPITVFSLFTLLFLVDNLSLIYQRKSVVNNIKSYLSEISSIELKNKYNKTSKNIKKYDKYYSKVYDKYLVYVTGMFSYSNKKLLIFDDNEMEIKPNKINKLKLIESKLIKDFEKDKLQKKD